MSQTFAGITNLCPRFSELNANAKLNDLMNAEGEIANIIAKFIFKIIK